METHEIRYFLATARELNFTRAAAACNVSQPALTRAIKKLEAELGGQLFLRRPGKIELTRLGRTVIPQLEMIASSMATVQTQAEALAEQQSNSLRLGVMCTIGPMNLIEPLTRLKAGSHDLEVSIIEAKAGDIVELLAADEIDIGITAWPSYPDQLAAVRLYDERYAVAMPVGHALSARLVVPLAELAGMPSLERLNCEFDDYYEARIGKWSIELDTCFSSEQEDWIMALILADLGLAIVPEFMTLQPGIVARPLIEPEVRREVSAVTLRGRPLAEAAQQFLRIARAHKWTSVVGGR